MITLLSHEQVVHLVTALLPHEQVIHLVITLLSHEQFVHLLIALLSHEQVVHLVIALLPNEQVIHLVIILLSATHVHVYLTFLIEIQICAWLFTNNFISLKTSRRSFNDKLRSHLLTRMLINAH